jgi:catechol 2,3-dioxygenase-like lactoylglutathione lyase family enzyme
VFQEMFPILSTPDLPRALGFYRDLLGCAVTYQFPPKGEPDYVSLTLGPSQLGIAAGRGEPAAAPETGPPSGQAGRPDAVFVLWVYVDDCDRAVTHLQEHGVSVLVAPADQPWGERMAEVADFDGNRVILASRA